MKNKLIEEIHSEFDSAQERLLEEARLILNQNHSSIVEMSERLKAIGFINTPTAKKGIDLKNKLVKSEQEAELIEYYRMAYPFLKFLTESELDRICKKYGLVYKPVQNYIGEIPIKNVIDIENAQQRKNEDTPNDRIWCELKRDNSFMLLPSTGWPSIFGREWYKIPKRIEGRHFSNHFEASSYLNELGFEHEYTVASVINYRENRQGLFICAPKSEFKGEQANVSFLEVKDPIVFRYVRGGVQVLTKWGLEAEKEKELIVDKLN